MSPHPRIHSSVTSSSSFLLCPSMGEVGNDTEDRVMMHAVPTTSYQHHCTVIIKIPCRRMSAGVCPPALHHPLLLLIECTRRSQSVGGVGRGSNSFAQRDTFHSNVPFSLFLIFPFPCNYYSSTPPADDMNPSVPRSVCRYVDE